LNFTATGFEGILEVDSV